MKTKDKITADVEISTKGEVLNIKMELKKIEEIEECEDGKIILFGRSDGGHISGLFVGMDGETIILKSLVSDTVMGLEMSRYKGYLEEIDPVNEN